MNSRGVLLTVEPISIQQNNLFSTKLLCDRKVTFLHFFIHFEIIFIFLNLVKVYHQTFLILSRYFEDYILDTCKFEIFNKN